MPTATELKAIVVILVAMALGGFGSRVLSASQPAASGDVLAALLVEVKGLRAALEQMSSASGRIQLSVARLQIEEQRIAEAGKRLQDLRQRLGDVRRDVQDNESRIADLEKKLAGSPDEDVRHQMEFEVSNLKRAVGPKRTTLSELTSEETQLAQDIATEQARWVEVSRRLDDLDASMTIRR